MSQPAPITSRADWDDVVDALAETVDDIRDTRARFAEALDELRGDQEMADPDRDEQERDDELRRRDEELDAAADGRVDGNYDPDPDT
jgi:hypothetical protein